jgi:hypothetical protein
MKIICDKCNAENELGRVFCTNCGQKLDLTQHTSIGEIREGAFSRLMRLAFKIGRIIVTVAICLAVLAAVWPVRVVAPRSDLRSVQRVSQKLQAIKMLQSGQSIVVAFTEPEINAFLDTKKNKIAASALAVAFTPAGFECHAALAIPVPFTLPVINTNQLPYSMGVSGRFTGGRFQTQGRVGHLPLPGPLGAFARQKIAAAVQEYLEDPKLAVAAQSATFGAGRVEMLFAK